MRKTQAIIIALLIIFSGMNAKSAVANESSTSAICISLYERNYLERIAFAAFSELTCGHYQRALVITNRPKTEAPELSEKRIKKIRNFLHDSETVDLFIFGHTNSASIWFRNKLESDFSGKLRMVYNSGCTDGQEVDGREWLKSARVFVGHPGDNFGGKFTPSFTRNWFRGKPLSEAVQLANRKLDKSKYFESKNDPLAYLYGDGALVFP